MEISSRIEFVTGVVSTVLLGVFINLITEYFKDRSLLGRELAEKWEKYLAEDLAKAKDHVSSPEQLSVWLILMLSTSLLRITLYFCAVVVSVLISYYAAIQAFSLLILIGEDAYSRRDYSNATTVFVGSISFAFVMFFFVVRKTIATLQVVKRLQHMLTIQWSKSSTAGQDDKSDKDDNGNMP